jgi:hypothetical protein
MSDDPEQIAQWRRDFEHAGEHEVEAHIAAREYVSAQRLAAFQWLKDKRTAREQREASSHWFVKWTFWAAVAAVVVGIVGVVVTLRH